MMVYTTIILAIAITGLFSVGLATPYVLSQFPNEMEENEAAKLIPVWVDQTFKWYAKGQISQAELVNSIKYLIENDIMILDPEKAGTINQLKKENRQLHDEIILYKQSDLELGTQLNQESIQSKKLPYEKFLETFEATDWSTGYFTILQPPGNTTNDWIGAPSSTLDPETGNIVVVARERNWEERGHTLHILTSPTGLNPFISYQILNENDWAISGAKSCEESSIVKQPRNGLWYIFLACSDGINWEIYRFDGIPDLTTAQFNASSLKKVFKVPSTGWDKYEIKSGPIQMYGSLMVMIFKGADEPGINGTRGIGLAYSNQDGDPGTWVENIENPIITSNNITWAKYLHPNQPLTIGEYMFVPYDDGFNGIGILSVSMFEGIVFNHDPNEGRWIDTRYMAPVIVNNTLFNYYEHKNTFGFKELVGKSVPVN